MRNKLLTTLTLLLLTRCGASSLPIFVGGMGLFNDRDGVGYVDAKGAKARFWNPKNFAIDKDGNLFVIDSGRVRKVNPEGEVSTFVGSGKNESSDGKRLEASFKNPNKIDIDENGNLFITDQTNNSIRKVDPSGNVSTINVKMPPFLDFPDNYVNNFKVAKNGLIYLVSSQRIFKFNNNSSDFFVEKINVRDSQTIAVYDLNLDSKNNLFLSIDDGRMIMSGIVFDSEGKRTDTNNFIKNKYPDFDISNFSPYCLTIDSSDNLYIADPKQYSPFPPFEYRTGTGKIYKFSSNGKVTVISNYESKDQIRMLVDSKRKYLYILNTDKSNMNRIKLEDK